MTISDGTNETEVTPEIAVSGSSYTVTYTPSSPLEDGSYTVKITVSDKVSNSANSSITFNIDATSPTVVDTDNDGESDSTEKALGSDWLDPSSTSGSTSFWPKDGEKINAAALSSNANKIMLLIEDVYNTQFSTGPNIDASTVTISGPVGSFTFGANNSPYPKSDVAAGSVNPPSFGAHIWSRFKCQIPVPLATDGTDDGTYTVEITPVDFAGNVGSKVTRTFIYDTVVPTITAVNVPSAGDTADSVTFAVDAADANGISDNSDAVKLYVLDSNFVLQSTNNLIKDTTTASRYSFSVVPSAAGTYYYYFTATDYAGNVSTYPANADNNQSQALKLVVTDKTGPWAVIGNQTTKGSAPTSYIKTMVGVPVDGTFVSNYTDATTPSVNSIPPVYSATNNILQATIEDDAAGAKFQYKLSTATSWTDLTANQTATNQVWEATWNTTNLPTGTYDIRVVAWDVRGNTSTPTSVTSSGWVQVELKDALAPVATIDTSKNVNKVADGKRVNGTVVLCAKTSATGNIDFSSVTFQYKSESASGWTDISTDGDSTDATLTNVTFTFDYSDLPRYIENSLTSIDTSTITGVTFDCSNNAYDTAMTKSGDKWSVTIPFPIGVFDYKFKIDFSDGSSLSVADVNQQDSNGTGKSRIFVDTYTAVWNVSSLADGTYFVRAVAKDSRGISDSDAAYITIVVDKTAPTSVSITQPTISNNRLKTGAATTLYADVTGEVSAVFFLYSADGGETWNVINWPDTNSINGWSSGWTPPSLSNDATYLLKAYAVDASSNIAESSAMSVVLDATNPTILSFTINSTSATSVDLNYGTAYNWTVTTMDPDIDNLTFNNVVISSSDFSWSPSNKVTSYTGSGTASDPYKFRGTLYVSIDPAFDNLAETITATLTDKSGRTDAVSKTVNFKDVTPSHASILSIDGMGVASGNQITTADKFIKVVCSLPDADGGVLKYQYRPVGSSTWITWSEDMTPANGDFAIFPPDGTTLSSGDYELRILSIDDDNNADPSPSVVRITVDPSQPDIKPASIISATGGILTAVEYDELVDQVQFEYREQGSSDWLYLGADFAADSAFGNAGNTWSTNALANLPAGTYEVRAIAQFAAQNASADSSLTPVSTVQIKQDIAGNKIYVMNPENRISVSMGNVSFSSSTFVGAENTLTANVSITSTQTLSNVTARLLLSGASGSVDRFLNVSGSGGSWLAAVDFSELSSGGNGRVVINATDASGNAVSVSQPFAVVASAANPGGVTVGRVTLGVAPFGSALENNSTLAIAPAAEPTTPASQSSLISPVGEPWEFLLSDPGAFKVSNSCTITMSYADNELEGVDENKIGIAYWDDANGRWSSDGITNVTRDLVANTVTFTVNHFSRFCLAAIDTEPTVTFVSPQASGYAATDPIIEADISDGFSAIRSVKVEVDGVDQTSFLYDNAGMDGIDNDGNGLIDEQSFNGNVLFSEEPLNQSGATSAKYKVKAPLHLSAGSHTIKITATNEEGISTTQAVQFTAGEPLEIRDAKALPNPFNPDTEDATIDFTVSADAYIKISVFDFAGREVYSKEYDNQLRNGHITDIKWNGRDGNRRILANGVYFVKIEASGVKTKVEKTIKIAVLR